MQERWKERHVKRSRAFPGEHPLSVKKVPKRLFATSPVGGGLDVRLLPQGTKRSVLFFSYSPNSSGLSAFWPNFHWMASTIRRQA